jgi:hypothetical protein
MVALLRKLGILPTPAPVMPREPEDTRDDLTMDQIAYLHELADERRRIWLEATRAS